MRSFLTVLLFSMSSASFGCECAPQSLDEKIKAAEVVVIASIEKYKLIPRVMENFPEMYEIEFEVDNSIKGNRLVAGEKLLVVTPSEINACGVELDKTKKYKLILSKYDFDATATIVTCDGSGPIGDTPQ